MSTNYTENFDLCQWEPTDPVQRVEFNADNAKLEAALSARNCQIYTLTYIGNGTNCRSFTYPHKPMIVFVLGGDITFMCAIYGMRYIHYRYGISSGNPVATWTKNSLSWSLSEDNPIFAANEEGKSYTLVALLDADS